MNVVVDGVQTITPAPVFRASVGTAAAFRLVSGQECFGPAASVRQVESASGAVLAGAVRSLGLVALGEGLLERRGYGDEQAQVAGGGIAGGGIHSDNGSSDDSNDSSKGDNGSKPMTPWDFRTSSPPG